MTENAFADSHIFINKQTNITMKFYLLLLSFLLLFFDANAQDQGQTIEVNGCTIVATNTSGSACYLTPCFTYQVVNGILTVYDASMQPLTFTEGSLGCPIDSMIRVLNDVNRYCCFGFCDDCGELLGISEKPITPTECDPIACALVRCAEGFEPKCKDGTCICSPIPEPEVYKSANISKNASENFYNGIDSEVIYTIEVCNDGTEFINNINVSEYIPSELLYNSHSVEGQNNHPTFNPSTGIWSVSNLFAGQCRVLSLSFITTVAKVNITNMAIMEVLDNGQVDTVLNIIPDLPCKFCSQSNTWDNNSNIDGTGPPVVIGGYINYPSWAFERPSGQIGVGTGEYKFDYYIYCNDTCYLDNVNFSISNTPNFWVSTADEINKILSLLTGDNWYFGSSQQSIDNNDNTAKYSVSSTSCGCNLEGFGFSEIGSSELMHVSVNSHLHKSCESIGISTKPTCKIGGPTRN